MFKVDTQKTPASKDWHRADIKAALEKRGLSLARLSRQNKYARSAGSTALSTPWPRMERLIANAIGVPPQEIWPTRYDANGSPKPRAGSAKKLRPENTTAAPKGNVHEQGVNRHGARTR